MDGLGSGQGVVGMNAYAKLAASGALFGALFYLVLVGKIAPGDFQTLAVGALGALGGFHAGRFPGGGK